MATVTPAATYPVAGAYATNPSYSGTFIPTLWSSKMNVKFYAATMFTEIANSDWQGEIGSMGDKVIINVIPTIDIRSYVVGTALTYDVPTPSTVELQIDKGYYFGFKVNDVLEYQAKPNLMNTFSEDAAQQMKIKVERDAWLNTLTNGAGVLSGLDASNYGATAGKISAAYNLGTDTAPVTLTGGNILQTITAMASVLDEQNVPESDRWLVLTPYDRQILMQSNLANAQFIGDASSMQRNGKIGVIDRFNVYVSNLTPSVAATKKWDGSNGTTEAKRHMMLAGHKSALTFASQITKTETVRDQNDFGDLIRGLQVCGYKLIANQSLALAIVN